MPQGRVLGTLMSPGLCGQGQGTGRERVWEEAGRELQLAPASSQLKPSGSTFSLPCLALNHSSQSHVESRRSVPSLQDPPPISPAHRPALFSLSSPLGEKNLEEGRGEGGHGVVGQRRNPAGETDLGVLVHGGERP